MYTGQYLVGDLGAAGCRNSLGHEEEGGSENEKRRNDDSLKGSHDACLFVLDSRVEMLDEVNNLASCGATVPKHV